MHHHSRFSSAHHHQHWHPVVLLALIVLGLLGACGTAPNAPAQKPVTPVPSTEAAHQATILLYATYSAPYNTFDSQGFQDTVTALKASDGSVLWQYHVSGVVDTNDEHALMVVDGVVYITTNSVVNAGTQNVTSFGSVYALRAKDGTLLWHYQVKGGIQLVAVIGGVVYITAGELSALRASDGTVLWHRQVDSNVTGFIADHGILYISTGLGNPGSVSALHANDGSLYWQDRLGHAAFSHMSPVNGILYVGGRTGDGATTTLYVLRPQDGTTLWHSQSNVFMFSNVSNGTVYLNTLGAGGTTAFALRASDGSQLWHEQPATLALFLVVQGDVLYGINPGVEQGEKRCQPLPILTIVCFSFCAVAWPFCWQLAALLLHPTLRQQVLPLRPLAGLPRVQRHQQAQSLLLLALQSLLRQVFPLRRPCRQHRRIARLKEQHVLQ
jgi:outer membrane protein assembly factor BamB